MRRTRVEKLRKKKRRSQKPFTQSGSLEKTRSHSRFGASRCRVRVTVAKNGFQDSFSISLNRSKFQIRIHSLDFTKQSNRLAENPRNFGSSPIFSRLKTSKQKPDGMRR